VKLRANKTQNDRAFRCNTLDFIINTNQTNSLCYMQSKIFRWSLACTLRSHAAKIVRNWSQRSVSTKAATQRLNNRHNQQHDRL
jgi:hypothetical protein